MTKASGRMVLEADGVEPSVSVTHPVRPDHVEALLHVGSLFVCSGVVR